MKEKLKGKKAIDKLIEDQFESVAHVLWNPEEYEMDDHTRQYWERKIEFAIYLLQNIRVLRGEKPHFFWSDIPDPEAFWREYESNIEGFKRFRDPVSVKYERMQKRRAK